VKNKQQENRRNIMSEKTEQKSEKGEAKYERKPNRKIRIRTSEDGRYVIVDVIESWVLPKNYIAKIVENAGNQSNKRPDQSSSQSKQELGG